MRCPGQRRRRRAPEIDRARNNDSNCSKFINTTPSTSHRNFPTSRPISTCAYCAPRLPVIVRRCVRNDPRVVDRRRLACRLAAWQSAPTSAVGGPLPAIGVAGGHAWLVGAILSLIEREGMVVGIARHEAPPVGPDKQMRIRPRPAVELARQVSRGHGCDPAMIKKKGGGQPASASHVIRRRRPFSSPRTSSV